MTDQTHSAREFPVTTNFQIEALKPGGLPLSAALEQAERNLAALRDTFPEALAGQINDLQSVAVRARGGDPSWRDELKRLCGDLSDAATTLGLGLVAFVARHLRDACDDRDAARQYEAIIARHVEALRLYGGNEFHNYRLSDMPDLDARLGNISNAIERGRV